MILSITILSYGQIVNLIPPEHLYNDIEGVLYNWKTSGTHAFDQPLNIAHQIDVTEYNIFPNGTPCGDQINALIKSLDPTPSAVNMYMLYFPPGGYLIDKQISLPGFVILKGAGGDFDLPLQTHFHFNLGIEYAHPCISMSHEKNGLEDIYIIDDTPYTPSIAVYSTPLYFLNGSLSYGVTGATSMFTSVVGKCSGYGSVSLNYGVFICGAYLESGIAYNVTTTFSNTFESISVTHVSYAMGEDKLIGNKHQFKTDEIVDKKNSEPSIVKAPDAYYQNTISISGVNNWVRGVESGTTRKYHIYIGGGEHNTISGCYIHHAVDYSDNGGRGYGVCLSGTAKFNRIEDNIFEHLRHSMVLQGDAERNVFGYNFSRDVYAFNGGFSYNAADLLLHGKAGNANTGPKTNLLEGNYTERIQIDDVHEYNGPFNTFFRNFAMTTFQIKYVPSNVQKFQYKQNVIGSRMEPKGSTKSRIQQEGYSQYWVDNPNYMNIPDMYASYYYDTKPDFYYQSLPWPLKPWAFQPPATIRCNMGLTRPVYAGWGSYAKLCGPPNYKFNGVLWQNASEEYRAMDKIELSMSYAIQNTDLYFHAGGSVLLNPGFKVMVGNNHVILKAGDVCGAKTFNFLDNSNEESLKNKTIQFKEESLDSISVMQTRLEEISDYRKFSNEITIYPNPNNGEFIINGLSLFDNIEITNIISGKLKFDIFTKTNALNIKITTSYSGLAFIKIMDGNFVFLKKVIIQK